jgi:phosphoribosyl 1,2-cyclic phosphodiesterase
VVSKGAAILPHSQAPLSDLAATFWGVRGSAPVFGPEHAVFGGSTMCVEIGVDDSRIIVDAGSGIHKLGRRLRKLDERNVDILLTHYHIDHIMGLAAFPPLFRKGTTVTLHAPILEGRMPVAALTQLFSAPLFPVGLDEVGATVAIRAFRPGESFRLGNLEIGTILLRHPGGACGFRATRGRNSIAVIADCEHATPDPDPGLRDFCAGAGLLLYDSHWDETRDYAQHRGWGHSTWQAGLRLARAAGAGRLGCIHHAPEATDAALLEREGRLRAEHAESFFAREGDKVDS